MALQSRNLVLTRRAAAIADLSERSIADGNVEVDAAEGVLRVNCTHQVGIATQTEVGLVPSRYPIRVVIADPKMKYAASANETVCRYWAIKHADNSAVAYSRKPIVNTVVLTNLYACTSNLDDLLWDAYIDVRNNTAKAGQVPNLTASIAALYALSQLINPTLAQMTEMSVMLNGIVAECVAHSRHPYFQVGDNAVMQGVPHGKSYTSLHGIDMQKIPAIEAALTLKLNYGRLKARYDTLGDGIITIAAYAIMIMFREGLAESYESTEYHTVTVSPNGGKSYTVEEIHSPSGVGAPEGIQAGDEINYNGVVFNTQLIEISTLLVMISGLMHYLFNHTTGGTVCSGALLTTLAMFNYISGHNTMDEQITATSLMYEALHPANKRAIANIFFNKSKVVTHGRSSTFRKYERFSSDAFFQIRSNPFPAGSHKAYICLTALRRVLQAGLGPFLPWADQLTTCINTCKDVLTAGARAHIGSAYYTGDPPLVQPASLDQYLPELATYLHTFNKGDSLTMSPHMSLEVANRAGMNWQNLLKDLKAKDISSTPAETVRAFLATAGAVNFTFDPSDEGTWAKAATDSALAEKVISSVFG